MKIKLKIKFYVIKPDVEPDVELEEICTISYGVYDSYVRASRAYRSFHKMMDDKEVLTSSGVPVFFMSVFEPVIELAQPKSPNQESDAPF